MEHVTSEDGCYGRCYVNKITEGVISMRRAIYGRNYSTRTIIMKGVMSIKMAATEGIDIEVIDMGRCEMNKNGHHWCLAIMNEVISTRMGIIGAQTVPVLELARDLNRIMPKLQGGKN